jgi:hypothetical protein
MNDAFRAKISTAELHGRRNIGCNPRTIGRREHLALPPAAPSWIRIAGGRFNDTGVLGNLVRGGFT